MASSRRRVSLEGATCSSVRRRRARSSNATRAAEISPAAIRRRISWRCASSRSGIERDAATRDANRVRQRAGRLGVRGQALEHVAEAVAVRLAGLVDPLRVEPRQQLAVAQVDGLLQPPLPNEPLELPGVHEDAVADEPDHVARRHEDALARRAERAPDGDELGSQALARARVEHIGPEATRDLRARVHARMKREPAEQRACPPALGHRQCDAV